MYITNIRQEVQAEKTSIATAKLAKSKKQQEALANDTILCKVIKHQSQKGASLWLTTLPVENLGFVMNAQEFQDALCLRYNLPISNMPTF